jgi:hypothetical protein
MAVSINGVSVGQALTNSAGVARIAHTIPSSAQGTQLSVRYTDESGGSATRIINITPGCPAAGFNCDGRVDRADLSILLSPWDGSGACDLDTDGVVNAPDLSQLVANWKL